MSAKEKTFLNKLQLIATKHTSRLFRNNSGSYQTIEGYFIKYGLGVGTGDLIGPTVITIEPHMVGRKMAIFTNCEVKTGKTRITKEQLAFHHTVIQLGGISMILRVQESTTDAELEGQYIESINQFRAISSGT